MRVKQEGIQTRNCKTFLNDVLKMSLNLRNFQVTNLQNFKNNVIERNLIHKYTKFNTKTITFRHKYK